MHSSMYCRVLFPTDGSEGSRRAIDLAIDTASHHDAVLDVLYVVDTHIHTQAARVSPRTVHEQLGVRGREATARATEHAVATGVETTEPILEHESSCRAILDYADDRDCDLIVMGPTGAPASTASSSGAWPSESFASPRGARTEPAAGTRTRTRSGAGKPQQPMQSPGPNAAAAQEANRMGMGQGMGAGAGMPSAKTMSLDELPEDFDFESQEWTTGQRKGDQVLPFNGMKFLVSEPDDDSLFNLFERMQGTQNTDRRFREVIKTIVKKPEMTDERLEERFTAMERMLLASQCLDYAGATDLADFQGGSL